MMFNNPSTGYAGYHPIVDYFNAMDADSYGPPDSEMAPLGVADIGMSVPLGISAANVAGIYAKIRSGVGNIELGFPGTVRGQRQQQTPEMYGEDQRQAIREMAAANEVKFTTHAAYGIMGLSGFTGDNPYNVWFQREQRKVAVDEIKKAIEFARDTAGGGSVVVHTGEADRPLSEQPWAQRPDGTLMFKQYEEEPAVARFRVVDERNGQVLSMVWKNRRVARPKWIRADNNHWGEEYNGENGETRKAFIKKGDYMDYLGRKIPERLVYDHEYGRVPEYNPKTGRFVNEMYDWNDMVRETNERNAWLAMTKGKRVSELNEDERATPDEIYLRSTLETNEGHSRGWSMQYGVDTQTHLENVKKIKKALVYYEKLEKVTPPEDMWKLKSEVRTQLRPEGSHLIPTESKTPTEMLKEALTHEERNLLFARQASDSQLMQAEDSYENQQYLVNSDKYAIREATKSYAEVGIHAMDCSIDPKKPVFIAMENIFPERYGGHPQELKRLIRDAREEMVERLAHKKIKDPASSRWTLDDYKSRECDRDDVGHLRMIDNPYFRGMNEDEARERAELHIRATLDTGHLNLWRKYWQNDPHKSLKENDGDFKKWLLNEVEDLAKNKMVGNVHLTDNFGYQDDHLAPGQGSTPVREIVTILRKHGYDQAWTVEPGADASTDVDDFHGLMKAWRHFGTPVYGMGMRVGASQSWTDIHYSYFGQNQPPYFIFGGYSPSQDWTLWTGTPME